MNETIIVGFMVLFAASTGLLCYAVARLVAALRAKSESDAELLAKMSDQVVANSDYQIQRMQIAEQGDVARDFSKNVLAPRAGTVNGTFPPEESDYISEPRP